MKKNSYILGVYFLALGFYSLAVFDVAAEEVTELPETLVTATRSNKLVDETPVASYVVTAEQMEKRNIKSVDEAIGLIPGVFQRRGKGFMDTLNAITLRGVPDAKRSLIMVDGLAINDAYTGGADVGGFAPEDLERVEVVLGPGSSLYGSSAMGGVVNFVSRMPKAEEYRFKLAYGNGLGTDRAPANLLRTYGSAGNAWQNGLSFLISLVESRTDGYVTDEVRSTTAPPAGVSGAIRTTTPAGATSYTIGDKGNNVWRDSQLAIRAAFRIDAESSLSASYKRTVYRYDYTDYRTYLRNVAGAPLWTYTNGSTVRAAAFLPGQGEMTRDIFSLGMETRLGESILKVQGGLIDIGTNWYTTVTSSLSTPTGSGGAASNAYSSTPSRSSQFEATVSTPLFARHLLVWGVSRRDEKADSSEYNLGDWRDENSRTGKASESGGKAATTGLFAQAELELGEAIRAYAGVRYDLWKAANGYSAKYGAGAFSRSYAGETVESVSPRLGATWSLSPRILLRTSLGKAFRAPNIYDLYRTWRSTAGTVYAGNPALEPETLLGVDLGADLKPWPGGELKVTVFHNQFRNMIYRKTVKDNAQAFSICGQALNAAQDNCRVWDNAGRALGRGIELALRQALSSQWAVFGSLAYNDTKILENGSNPDSVGKKFTQVPQTTVALGAEWQSGAWSAATTARYVAGRYASEDNSDSVSGVPGAYDPYTLLDVRAAYRIDRHYKLALSIDNLLNHEYYASYRAPGRAWFLELSGAF